MSCYCYAICYSSVHFVKLCHLCFYSIFIADRATVQAGWEETDVHMTQGARVDGKAFVNK